MGTRQTHKKRRQALRKKLRAMGCYSDEEIERIIERRRRRHADARERDRSPEREEERQRAAEVRAEWEEETYRRLSPDDRRHRPAQVDSVLTGEARATGATATSVKRRKALTKWEYERLGEAGGSRP